MVSSPYCSQLADDAFPELASTFICAGMLAEAIDDREHAVAAAWNWLHAAWVLEDEDKSDFVRIYRGKAADAILALLKFGNSFSEQPGASEAILTDCLRRSGRGAEALQVIANSLSQPFMDVIHEILRFQQKLVETGDTGVHQVSEALEANEP